MITKKQFQKFVEIQQSGLVNMFDITTVAHMSEGLLTPADCREIIKNYNELFKNYNN